jgi:hypothetical protein
MTPALATKSYTHLADAVDDMTDQQTAAFNDYMTACKNLSGLGLEPGTLQLVYQETGALWNLQNGDSGLPQ